MRGRPPGREGWASPEPAWPLGPGLSSRAAWGSYKDDGPARTRISIPFQFSGKIFVRGIGVPHGTLGEASPGGWHPDNCPQRASISVSGVTRSPVPVSASLHLLLLGVNPLPLPFVQADRGCSEWVFCPEATAPDSPRPGLPESQWQAAHLTAGWASPAPGVGGPSCSISPMGGSRVTRRWPGPLPGPHGGARQRKEGCEGGNNTEGACCQKLPTPFQL